MRYSRIFKEAKRLYDLGFAIHWLHPRSKRPVESGWTTGPRKKWAELESSFKAGLNIGVRLGTPSRLRSGENWGYLAVLDVDVKSSDPRHRSEALAAVDALLVSTRSGTAPRVASGRGNGSSHYYVLTEKPFKTFNAAASAEMVKVLMPSKKASKAELKALTAPEIEAGWRMSRAWEISLYSDGRQVVLPPSVHPDSGELYRWERPITACSDLPILDLANVIGSALSSSLADAFAQTFEDRNDAPAPLEEFNRTPVDLGWLPISEEVRAGILEGRGVEDRSGFLLRASNALFSAGLTRDEVLTVLTDPETFLGACAYDHAQTKDRRRAAAWVDRYTLQKVETERDASQVFSKSPVGPPRKLSADEQAEQAEQFALDLDWKQSLDRTDRHKVKATLKNIDLIFSNRVEGTAFTEDLFASRIEYGADTPWGGKSGAYIKDIDMILVKRWLADTEFGIEPSTGSILEATSLVAHRCRVHPVREWLESLKWDGVPRASTWIQTFCEGEAAQPYLSEISRKFLLAMVKRVFEPGCQWDYVLVLEGQQGKYKSSIARALASDRWFMDNLPDLKDKDSMLNLQGKWLIELGELADVKRADYNLVKAYLVRRTDTVRPHYGRLMADVPRQSVFIGTINEGQYLKDPTGNRRYWPVKVGLCDVRALSAVRDQLFAEAMHLYRTTNEVLMLGPEATVQATDAQEDRRVDDDESEMRAALVEYVQSEKSDEFNFSKFRARDLMFGPDVPWAAWNSKGYLMNVAAQVLANLGFERHKIQGQRYWRMTEETLIKRSLRKVAKPLCNNPGAPPEKGMPLGAPFFPVFDGQDDLDFR